MKVLAKTLSVLFVLLVLLTLAGFLLPGDWEISRSIVIEAPPSEIHPWLEDLRLWQEWSVWAREDPAMRVHYEGPRAGVDARMAWSGETSGSGELVITASDPNRGVWYDLVLGEGMAAKDAILYEEVPGGTEVTWLSRGELGANPVARWVGLALDSVLGPDYERNLENVKELVEERATRAPPE